MKQTEKKILREKQTVRPFGLAWFIIVLVVAVLIFSYLSFFRPSLINVEKTVNQLHLQAAQSAKEKIDNFFDSNLKELGELSETVSLTSTREEAKVEIERFAKKKPWFYEISIVNTEGQELLKTSQYTNFGTDDLKNYSSSEFFEKSKRGETYFSNVQTTDKAVPYMLVSMPLGQPQDNIYGILTAKLSFREIWNIVSATKVGKSGKAYLVDSEGFIIAHPNNSLALKRFSAADRSVVQEVLGTAGTNADTSDTGMGMGTNEARTTADAEEKCAEYVNEEQKLVYAVALPLKIPGGAVVVEEPREEALVTYYRIRSAAITLNFVAAILLFLLIFNTKKLSNIFSRLKQREDQLNQEATKRDEDLNELDRTTKMLLTRDMELSRANERLEQLDAVKSDFVSIAAHQLRTPLTGIKWSFLALLEKETGQLNQDQKKIIADGLKAINHTITLINDLLNVAHIEEGKFGFNLQSDRLEPILEEAFQRFQSLAGEKGIWLSLELPQEKISGLHIDKEKIALVLDNLLDNAIKYSSPGGKVSLKLEKQNDAVKITVRDTGIGIPESQLDRVFTKFFRAENALLFQTSGTGLGLYMAKNIIERHCGTIEAASVENKGTTFTITLPLVCKL